MSRTLLFALLGATALGAATLTGCSNAHDTDTDTGRAPDAASGTDAGTGTGTDASADGIDGSLVDAYEVFRPDANLGVGEPPPGVVVCGGVECASGQECCLLTGACVTIGDPSCVVPSGTTAPNACARDSDCAAGELCDFAVDAMGFGLPLCSGLVGACATERPPSDCGGFGLGVCGCDGRTYPDPCAASRAGVRVSRVDAPCGIDVYSNGHYACDATHDCFLPMNAHCDLGIGECVRDHPFVYCGIDSQCPAGERCCGITGACYDPATPASCAVPPPGTFFPCADDEDCARWDGSYWGDGLQRSYCDGPGPDGACGMAGGCRMVPSSCSGILAPVCGCDGNAYQNECEAQRMSVRIAHTGGC